MTVARTSPESVPILAALNAKGEAMYSTRRCHPGQGSYVKVAGRSRLPPVKSR